MEDRQRQSDDDDRMEVDDEDGEDGQEYPPQVRSKHEPMKIPFGLPKRKSHSAAPIGEGEGFIFVQLPTRLPTFVKAASPRPTDASSAAAGAEGGSSSAAAGESADGAAAEREAAGMRAATHDRVLTEVSSGYLGKLVVHKSGKTRLLVQDSVPLLVANGLQTSFNQEVVSISTTTDEEAAPHYCKLGTINQRCA